MGGWVSENPNNVQIFKSVGNNGRSLIKGDNLCVMGPTKNAYFECLGCPDNFIRYNLSISVENL